MYLILMTVIMLPSHCQIFARSFMQSHEKAVFFSNPLGTELQTC